MKYNINTEDVPDHEMGLEIMRVLNLKGDKRNGRVQTTHGSKNPCGLARTIRHLSAEQLEKCNQELLSALIECADYLSEFLEEGRSHRVIRVADTAIAKAEGRLQ